MAADSAEAGWAEEGSEVEAGLGSEAADWDSAAAADLGSEAEAGLG